jgi:hypothetical protein
MAALLHEYHISKVIGDGHAGEWVAATFKDAGIKRPKSPLYLECLPFLPAT